MELEEKVAEMERKLADHEAGYQQHVAIIAALLRILEHNGLLDEAKMAIANTSSEMRHHEH